MNIVNASISEDSRVQPEEVGHDHVHHFFAELAQKLTRIFYVNF